ncbi:acyl transferase 15-like [Phragmites australis]|uniref:acyl transferase 15-like n=1 Tax=Phragmites australis TaxID=29695 RepID=UPI002D772131|nr:acyl transferase 15-like [Phragmites australis]
MSGVVVTKSPSVVVVPAASVAATLPVGDTVALSSFDKCVVPSPTTLLLTFDRPIHEPGETVKTALSRALVHYRPIAGRLDGEGGIVCTGEGVTFVGASATCALEELATGVVQLMDLAVRYPGQFCREAEPLLLVQVTEFSCGGFVVGVTWNHIVADGVGMGQFLQAVGELARGVSPPSIVPVRHWDDSLPGLPPSMVAAQKSTMNHGPHDLARLDVTVPSSLIRRVKDESGGTVFEVVTAVLWRCRTLAAMSADGDPESFAPLAFPCNVRAHVGAKDGYYGNCVTVQLVPATSVTVATSGIGDLVRMIRRAKEKVPDLLSNSSNGGAAPDGGAAEGQAQLGWYDALAVVSWRNLGFDAADFGGGGPARVMWPAERTVVPGCVVCPPCKAGRDDGVSVSSLCVKQEHAGAFLEELARLAAST